MLFSSTPAIKTFKLRACVKFELFTCKMVGKPALTILDEAGIVPRHEALLQQLLLFILIILQEAQVALETELLLLQPVLSLLGHLCDTMVRLRI